MIIRYLIRRIVFFSILVVSFRENAYSQGNQRDSLTNEPVDFNCLAKLKEYSKYWIQDSLAKNGFRNLFAEAYLLKCTSVLIGNSHLDITVENGVVKSFSLIWTVCG